MFVGRQTAILCGLDVLVAVVYCVGTTIEKFGNGLGLACCLDAVLRDANFVLLDFVGVRYGYS